MRAAVPVMSALFAACGPSIPEGRFRCDVDDDCPSGWTCRADQRCYSAPLDAATDASGTDGDVTDASDGDAGGADADTRDADTRDADTHDAGPCEPSQDDVNRCGPTCTVCPASDHGTSSCVEGSCFLSCEAGYAATGTDCVLVGAARRIWPPADAVLTGPRPTFRFAPGANASATRVDVCSDPVCQAVVVSVTLHSSATMFVPDALAPSARYYWRVTSLNSEAEIETSPVAAFTIPAIAAAAAAPTVTAMTWLNFGGARDDVAVGAPSGNQVFLYLSDDATGDLPASTAHSLTSTANGFGQSLGAAGDVDGDGRGDLVVGACSVVGTGSAQPPAADRCAASVFVYFGSGTTVSTDDPIEIPAPVGASGFGYSVAGAGDFDRDGYADIVVGAFYGNRAFVYFGGPRDTAFQRRLDLTPPGGSGVGSPGGLYGVSVSSAGDFNADGYDDVIVGQPLSQRAFVYLGGPLGVSAGTFRIDGSAMSNLGLSVSGAGDVNADGIADVVVGGNGTSPLGTMGGGVAAVYTGRTGAGGTITVAHATWSGASASGHGISVSGVGDVDGNGYADVLVGSSIGEAYIYALAPVVPSSPRWTFTPGHAAFGRFVGRVGWVTNDTLADWIVGACDAARTTPTCQNRALVYAGSDDVPTPAPIADWTGTGDFGNGVCR